MSAQANTAEPVEEALSEVERPDGGNNKLRLILLVIVPLLAILVALVFYLRGGRYVSTENAYVKSNVVAISSDVSGRAVEVLVNENQFVQRGEVLFRLDAGPLKLDVKQAKAQLDVARAEIEALRAEHSEALVSVAEANSRVEYLRREFERQKSLKKQGLGGGQAHDEARFELRAAQQRVNVLNERTRKSLATFNGNPDLPVEDHPTYLRASVAHEMAETQLAKTAIMAPADGIVSNVRLQPGEFVEAGNAVFSLIENKHVWVEANLKETQLTHIKEGQQATLEVDAYPDIEWKATVSSIAPATGAQFTLLPPQNATGNWVKVVQRVPVNLQVEAAEDAPVLRAGMTVSVRIDTERQRQAFHLVRNLVAADTTPDSVPVVTQTSLVQLTQLATVEDADSAPVTELIVGDTSTASDTTTHTAVSGSPYRKTPGLVALMEEQEPQKFTLELARSADISVLKELFDKLPANQTAMLYQLQTRFEGKENYGLATGLFGSRVQADEALAGFSDEVKRLVPSVRRISEVQEELITN